MDLKIIERRSVLLLFMSLVMLSMRSSLWKVFMYPWLIDWLIVAILITSQIQNEYFVLPEETLPKYKCTAPSRLEKVKISSSVSLQIHWFELITYTNWLLLLTTNHFCTLSFLTQPILSSVRQTSRGFTKSIRHPTSSIRSGVQRALETWLLWDGFDLSLPNCS